MLRITRSITKFFYKIRKSFWDYPDRLFFGNKSYFNTFSLFYQEGIPLSHFALAIGFLVITGLFVSSNVFNLIKIEKETLIEGVIMGVDEYGDTLKINRINPLVNSNIQLEKDICELIYQSLIRVTDNGEIVPVLADFVELNKGIEYQFKLKDNIYWQDGKPVTVDDVEATFNLLKTLEDSASTSTLYSRSAQKIDLERFENDNNSFKLVVKNEKIIPGFFEAVGFKILPAHLMSDLNKQTILFNDPYINRNPMGTGPYKLDKVTQDGIELVYNKYYFEKEPEIKRIRFKLFPTEESAFDAIQSGQIHTITRLSLKYVEQLRKFDNLDFIESDQISSEYWGIYFNLAQDGPAEFKDVAFRKAFVMAIDKQGIIEEMKNLAAPANGPIASDSEYYYKQKLQGYDPANAKLELDKLGWIFNTDNNVRVKAGKELRYTLITIDNPDRLAVTEKIRQNLADVGIQITVEKKSLSECVNDVIIPRSFELLLWGVRTLVDPDRYELFHSSNVTHPGLNIGSYISSEKRTQVIEGKTVKIATIDDDLDDGRRLVDEKLRKKKYEDFQKIIAKEFPMVFLYHPKELYIINKRLEGVDLKGIDSLEDRFETISNWKIDIENNPSSIN